MDEDNRHSSLSEGFKFGLGFWISGALLAATAGTVWRFVLPQPMPERNRTEVIVRDGPNGPTETLWIEPQTPERCMSIVKLPEEKGRSFIDAYRACRNGHWGTFGIVPEELR